MRNIDSIHSVPVLAPVSTTSAVQTDVVLLEKYHACKFLLQVGALAVNLTFTVEKCDNTTPSNTAAITFRYRKSAAVGTDLIGAWTAAAVGGVVFTGTTDNNMMIEILVDGSEIGADYPGVRGVLTPASGSACLVSGIAVLEPRYEQAVPPSAVA